MVSYTDFVNLKIMFNVCVFLLESDVEFNFLVIFAGMDC